MINATKRKFFVLVLMAGFPSAFAMAEEPASARITGLSLSPDAPVLDGSRASQRLLVTGHSADGSEVDVTGQCRFESSDEQIATVSDAGVVRPVANGTVTIRAILDTVQFETQVTVRNSDDETFNFRNHILPVFSRLNCNQMGCHGSPKGKNGFRLSLFEADPDADYLTMARGRMSRLIDPLNPGGSLLLLKATSGVPHGGGRRLSTKQPEYRLLTEWIAQQAPQGTETDPTLERIEIFPPQRVLQQGSSQPLLAEAYYSDGSMADVTQLVNFTSNDDLIATVSGTGQVEATGTGEAIIMARFSGRVAVARLAIPQDNALAFPDSPANNRIDELVLAKLRTLNITPSELTSDGEFVRRVYLDTLGTLPNPDEVRAFVADSRPEKRALLIDDLLDRPGFVDRRTLKWSDLLRVNRDFPIYLRSKGMWTYYNWIRNSMAVNKPMDQFVRELITSQGNTYEDGPANFHRVASVNPNDTAEQASMLFLGVRLGCARCHNHPFEDITWDDNLSMAAFFAKMRRRRLESDRQNEDVVYEARSGAVRHPKTRQPVEAQFLKGSADLTKVTDLRGALAGWMTAPENPWFARNMVNRVWFSLMGRGIVHEPDDFRTTNPPSNPALLDYLADQLAQSGFDMKETYRLILNSRTYQLSSLANASNENDAIHFSHYPFRQLDAEQMLDAVSEATGTPERFSGLPLGTRAAQLPDTYVRSVFLDLFGRPMRATTCECERSGEMHMGQAMHLISSEHMEAKLSGKTSRVKTLIDAGKPDAEIVDELYLATLSRLPTDAEKQRVFADPVPKDNRQSWFEDLLWALLNTKEFMFNH